MTQAHTDRAHAKLSPSASHRWMSCPGSIRLSEGIEKTSSVYADEGTAAHELCAACLNKSLEPEHFLGKWVNIDAEFDAHRFEDKKPATGRAFEVDDEMVDAVKVYVDYVRGLQNDDTEIAVEFRFDLQHVAEGMFGTGDAVVYNAGSKELHVIDFKYGRGVPVEPKENSQLLAYGLGAIKRHHNRGLSSVKLAVVQPRCGRLKNAPQKDVEILRTPEGRVYGSVWTTDAVGLMDFEYDLRVAAAATAAPDAPLNAGEWCKFCPVAATCPALRDHALHMAASEFDAYERDDQVPENTFRIEDALARVSTVAAWCKRVLEYAHEQAIAGKVPKGWKLVEKRAIRRWKDESTVAETLKAVYELEDHEIWAPQELATPAQVEKLMPGKNKEARAAILRPLVSKISSGSVLVPEHDIRTPVRGDGSEFLEGVD